MRQIYDATVPPVSVRLASLFADVCHILLACALLATVTHAAPQNLNEPTLAWMQATLDSWETNCRRDLRITVEPLPWVIFYDESRAWHLKAEKRLLPSYEASSHSLRFAGRNYPLIRVARKGNELWVPGRDPIAVDPAKPQAVAMLYDEERKPFFIIPLPDLFHRLAGPDHASNLDELFLGEAAHELTHTRHLVYAMPQIKRLRARYKLPESFDDNIIQQEFGTNDEYKRLYDEERKHLTNAILARDLDECRRAVEKALSVIRKRKERFFVGDRAGYSDLEDIFLAMEGLAMWVQYRTARARAPAGEEWLKTLITLSERHEAWSQEEGLGLFLLIDRLAPGWQTRFLSPHFPSPFAVLSEAIRKSVAPKDAGKLRKKRERIYRRRVGQWNKIGRSLAAAIACNALRQRRAQALEGKKTAGRASDT